MWKYLNYILEIGIKRNYTPCVDRKNLRAWPLSNLWVKEPCQNPITEKSSNHLVSHAAPMAIPTVARACRVKLMMTVLASAADK